MVTRSDLPVSTLNTGVFLFCESCWERYSATRGDYFWMPDGEPFTCGQCDELLVLATAHTTITPVLS